MTVARSTQVVVEALSQVDPKLRSSQVVVEALSQVNPFARVSQMVIETLSSNDDLGSGFTPRTFICT